MLHFTSDYMEGAAPEILEKLAATNLEQTEGYGLDPYSDSAREKIRLACGAPDGEIYFLIGGTQTNETILSTILAPYQGVLAAKTAHVNTHEAGAIEHGGHKVLTLEGRDAKLSGEDVREYCRLFFADANYEHEVWPGAVYISHPTEYGTLYTRKELEDLRAACDEYKLKFFLDGARLGYGLAASGTDVTLRDIAELTDVFYIGGTKVGALFGEAVVFPKPGLVPHFYTMSKQHGAMLAKGRITGIQFDALFTDDLYRKLGENGVRQAMKIRKALEEKGYEIYIDSPTNQQFTVVTKEKAEELAKEVSYGFMETLADGRIVIRFCTSWATTDEQTDGLIRLL
ncbi:MAG: beta-eliminating lyase-related protein [Eubacterium sp.]|nr:beta-eliminating lyase-related protein [Eubacterium sp.]